MLIDMTTMHTTTDIAARLNVDAQTVRRWITQGELTAIRVGPRLWRISEDALREFLDRNSAAAS